jgi:hypothetical protein
MIFDSGVATTTFKYTFDISVASNYYLGNHGLGYIIKYVKANGNLLNSWDKFVNVAATVMIHPNGFTWASLNNSTTRNSPVFKNIVSSED